MAKTTKAVKQLSYEQALKELEGILASLENESIQLDETMKMFERGKELIQHCQKLLDQAELKVRSLSDEKGTINTEE
jgi:exodeoxyribonuclease VII small subunit